MMLSSGKQKFDLLGPWRMQAKVPRERAAWFVTQQVQAFHQASNAAATGSVVTGLTFAVIIAIWHGLLPAALLALATGFASISRLLRKRRYLGLPSGIDNDRAERLWILRYAVVAGGVWGAACFALVAQVGMYHPLVLALIFPGLVFSGSFALDVVYAAALRYIALLSLGACAGLLFIGGTSSYFALAGLLAYALMFAWRAKLSSTGFTIRTINAVEAKEASETVHLLLNDYEEHSSDWLWEISADGRIVKPSERFQQVSGFDRDALVAMPLAALFNISHDREAFENLIENQQAFRDVVLNLTIDGVQNWWSLSGRPITDANGKAIGMRGVASDVTAAKHADAKIAYLARYDGLTDLPNRTLFGETLSRALSRRTEGALTAVLYLDLDHFKSINDTLGHAVGDMVLKTAATRIKSCISVSDTVARQGGDEFAVVLPEIATRAEAEIVAEAIVSAMAAPIMVDGQQVNTGASIGIAYAPDDVGFAQDLIKYADMALYHSKQNGRGRYSIFELCMHEAMQEKRQVELDLRVAVSRDELELYYQPLVNLETGETAGYEALLRWNHPKDGLVMPSVFIPVAEETGLIVLLGEWVIRNALMEVRHWPEHLSVSVNLSPAQMRSPNLVPTVLNALASSGVPAERLELEITETVLMHDTEANMAVLHQLRALGVRIALDDFGTGYSSLNYLRSFPFDKIKIDRCFVDDVDSREDSQAIVRAVTGLASSLGMVTTAEGVERKDQLDQLRNEGCTEVQGYFFAKPLPAINVVGRAVSGKKDKRAA
jgi:diguanylate cyclase (GGDEF)-like protein/PAS domain S-box-containing protein